MSRTDSLVSTPPVDPNQSLGYSSPADNTPQVSGHLCDIAAPAVKSGKITIKNVDLDQCPRILPEFEALRNEYEMLTAEQKAERLRETVTLADKHGNTLRLIYELVAIGVLDISPDQYLKLRTIYEKHDALLKKLDSKTLSTAEYESTYNQVCQGVAEFKKIVNELPVHDHVFVRQLGDLFGDRGAQDLFSLFVFDHLKNNHAPYEIIFSNHDALVMKQYEKRNAKNEWRGFSLVLAEFGKLGGQMREDADRSLVNLGVLLKHGIAGLDEVSNYIETAIKPYFKLVSYDRVDDKLVYSVHTSVDSLVFKALAEYFKIPFKFDTTDERCSTIDAINAEFGKKVAANETHLLGLPERVLKALQEIQDEQLKSKRHVGEPIFLDHPVHACLWSRNHVVVNDEALTKDIDVGLDRSYIQIGNQPIRSKLYLSDTDKDTYFYGHRGEEASVEIYQDSTTAIKIKKDSRYVNLETNLGKTERDNQGNLHIGYSGDYQPILKLIGKETPMPMVPLVPHKQSTVTPVTSPKNVSVPVHPGASLNADPDADDQPPRKSSCLFNCGLFALGGRKVKKGDRVPTQPPGVFY